jgi:hypothetical protein
LIGSKFGENDGRRLLPSLVRIDPTTGAWMKRVAKLRDFKDLERDALRQLSAARLAVLDAGADGRLTVELAHETLIDAWPRLREAVLSEASFLRWRSVLESLVAVNIEVLSEAQLREASTWIEVRKQDVPQSIIDLVSHSKSVDAMRGRKSHLLLKGAIQTLSSRASLARRRDSTQTWENAFDLSTHFLRNVALGVEIALRDLGDSSDALEHGWRIDELVRHVLEASVRIGVQVMLQDSTQDHLVREIDLVVDVPEALYISSDRAIPLVAVLSDLMTLMQSKHGGADPMICRVTAEPLENQQIRWTFFAEGDKSLDFPRPFAIFSTEEILQATVSDAFDGVFEIDSNSDRTHVTFTMDSGPSPVLFNGR